MRRLALLVCLAFACSGEEPVEFTPASVVDKLRILGIRAEPPEAAPGQPVLLTALVADPLAELRDVGWLWIMCDPSPDDPLSNVCASQDTLRSFDPEDLPEGVRVQPFFQMGFYFPPSDALDSLEEGSLERNRGVSATIMLVVWEGGAFEDLQDPNVGRQFAIKRIRIVDPQENPNRNPEIASLTVDGVEADDVVRLKAGSTVTFAASASEESAQRYVRFMPDGATEERTEQTVFSWYATGGRFSSGLEFSSRTTNGEPIGLTLPPRGVLPDNRLELFVVLRDARGGTDWERRSFRLVD